MAINFANNSSLANITSLPASISGGGLTLVSSQTASASASLEFSMDSTYDSYVFKYINIHGSTATSNFVFQTSTNGGSSYGVTLTSTFFQAAHDEADTATGLSYQTSQDHAQSTSFQKIGHFIGTNNDDNVSGMLQLFNPSSTTYVKHFICKYVLNNYDVYCVNPFVAGYFNTTSAINAIQFKFDSGNIDDGIIKMYGVS